MLYAVIDQFGEGCHPGPAKATRTDCCDRRALSLAAVGTMMKMMLLLAVVSRSALPPATTEAASIPVISEHSDNSTRHGGHRERGELWHMAVDAAGQRCTPNPLLERIVDPTKYELGCTEIEVSLSHVHENSTFPYVLRTRRSHPSSQPIVYGR